jgi:hypothetical protein
MCSPNFAHYMCSPFAHCNEKAIHHFRAKVLLGEKIFKALQEWEAQDGNTIDPAKKHTWDALLDSINTGIHSFIVSLTIVSCIFILFHMSQARLTMTYGVNVVLRRKKQVLKITLG